jgi:putative transcriptional regulator
MKMRLPELLEQKGKSLNWLAQESGLHYTTLHRYFHNETTGVNLDHIKPICDALDCDANALFGITPKRKK